LFANEDESVPQKFKEIPKDTYAAYIYINSFESNNIKNAPVGNAEIKGKSLEVSYDSESTQDEAVPNYALGEFSVVGREINELKIAIDGEYVEYSLSELK
jgi:hypothetical protein